MSAIALWISTLAALAGARVYERCELARDLHGLGVDGEQIATWVCIAFHESRFDTAAQNYGSGDHGLFQISELYWCGPGKACGAPCSAFRDEDISDDVKCALQIYKEHTRLQGDGFLAWVVYPHHCKHNVKKYIVDCDNYKNLPVKYEDRARYMKTPDIRNMSKSQTVNNPHRSSLTPRYLAINSIFQGSYNNEFERSYYDNNKQSNWLNFKVDDIDDLKLPGAVSVNQRPRVIEQTTRPTTTTSLDPTLAGIKPPSPRRIESNQFRRRKTFTEPLFIKNRIIAYDEKNSKTTPAPVTDRSETSLSFNEDLSHNIFLNLSPSKTVSKFLSPIQTPDLSRYNIKKPQAEESSASAILTYDDLARNPFLNTLPGFSFKSRTDSPFQVTGFQQNNARDYTLTTSRPVSYLRSFKEIESRNPEPKKTSLQTSENIDGKVSIEELYRNPFLSHLLRDNNIKPSTEQTKLLDVSKQYRTDFRSTTVKPIGESVYSSSQQSESSTKVPKTSVQRGRARYLSDVDKNTTEKPSTERSTITYSTRQYKTISRQRANTNSNDFKSTTAVIPHTDKPAVSSTEKPYFSESNRRNFRIETTTIGSETLHNVTKGNKVPITPKTEIILQTTSRPEISRRPDTASTTLSSLRTTSKPQTKSSTETTRIAQTTSIPHTTNRQQTASRTDKYSSTTSRPDTTSKPPTTKPYRSSKWFSEESRNFTISTTPKPSFTWRATNPTSTSTPWYSTTLKPTVASTTESSTAKTTISIFDLYLKPSTRPSYKPFEFTSSISRPYKLSIFAGGTTKPPPAYFTTKRPITEEVPKH